MDYCEGLCWVMKYYYQGCASWTWYYPYHYAPFSSDLVNLGNLKFNFKKGKPFHPFEQLMGVLPALSGGALPPKCFDLMTNPESPILDFYPEDFKIDMDGCRFAWQGVALLPFIDEKRLLDAMESIDSEFTEEEKTRNSFGDDLLFIHKNHSIVQFVLHEDKNFFKSHKILNDNNIEEDKIIYLTNTDDTDNLFGSVSPSTHGAGISALKISTIKFQANIENNQGFCFIFHHPEFPENHIWKSQLLPNVTMPPRKLGDPDFAKDRSYRFGKSQRNMLERSVTKFHDPRYQKTGNDNYQGGDYHGGKGSYNQNNKRPRSEISGGYHKKQQNNNNNNYDNNRNSYNSSKRYNSNSSSSSSSNNYNPYPPNYPPQQYPTGNTGYYNPSHSQPAQHSNYSPFASQYSGNTNAYSMGYGNQQSSAPYNPTSGYSQPNYNSYYQSTNYPPQQQHQQPQQPQQHQQHYPNYPNYPQYNPGAYQYHHTSNTNSGNTNNVNNGNNRNSNNEKDEKNSNSQYYNWNG